tara:strand:- start:525 stop:965 length:441 start_codon:yes stop_codon:yes gene_type:complete
MNKSLKFLFCFSFVFPFAVFSQKNNLKELTDLYKQQASIELKINTILENDPQLRKLLDSYSTIKIKEGQNTTANPKIEFTEKYFQLEAEKIKAILSEQNLNSIKDLFYSVQNSQYAKDISYIVLRQMEIAKEELEQGIRQFPSPKH